MSHYVNHESIFYSQRKRFLFLGNLAAMLSLSSTFPLLLRYGLTLQVEAHEGSFFMCYKYPLSKNSCINNSSVFRLSLFFSSMEHIPSNINISVLSSCLRILLWDTRTMGFLSFFLFCFQSLCNSVSQNWKAWTTTSSYSNSEPVKQSLNCIQRGVRVCKEEVIVVMEKLGISVEWDGDGIEEFGEQEIAQLFEKEASLAEVEEAFNVFDENKDGFIEATELRRVLCCLGLDKDLMECQKMINAVDQNGDELIDNNEFVKFMERSFG